MPMAVIYDSHRLPDGHDQQCFCLPDYPRYSLPYHSLCYLPVTRFKKLMGLDPPCCSAVRISNTSLVLAYSLLFSRLYYRTGCLAAMSNPRAQHNTAQCGRATHLYNISPSCTVAVMALIPMRITIATMSMH